MKPFNELIKSFDKIREYLRAFTVYGYKQREDFDHKSLRTYDNEKRRIQSYLSPYISEQTSSHGKRLGINFDYLSITCNPLFDGFKTKSFTKNDIMLHFILLDLLKSYPKLTLNEIYEHTLSDYLEHFETCKMFDQRTLRIKIHEYMTNGIILEEKEGKSFYYHLAPTPIDDLPGTTKTHLLYALSFYQNISPLGILGHFLLEQEDYNSPYFAFSHLHFSHTVDELILFDLLNAIKAQKTIQLVHTSGSENTVLPLKIVDNVEQGRRYVMVYHYQDTRYKFYRLDKLLKVKPLETTDNTFMQKRRIIDTLLDTTWGVALGGMDYPHHLEVWELILHIDETYEQALIAKIEQAHQEAILQRVGPDTFHYTLSILDANEAMPWLRQFIGRIQSIHCTNHQALNRFIKDIKLMKSYYEEVSHDTF